METSMISGKYYRPSGKIPVMGIVLPLVIGGLVAGLVGIGYGYLTLYNPLIYFSILGTIGFGFLAGFAASFGLNMGKVRAPLPAALLGLAAGAVGVYANWVAWLHGIMGRADIDMWVFSPGEMWTVMAMVSETGAWTIRSWTPTGIILNLFWGLEAAILLGFPVFLCWKAAKAPFCEQCDQWAEDVYSELRLGWPKDQAGLKRELETGNVAALKQLSAEPEKYTKVTLEACPACSQDGYLTVEACTEVASDKGKKSTDTDEVVRYLHLGAEAMQAARSLVEPTEG